MPSPRITLRLTHHRRHYSASSLFLRLLYRFSSYDGENHTSCCYTTRLGAGKENRTPIICLEGRGLTITQYPQLSGWRGRTRTCNRQYQKLLRYQLCHSPMAMLRGIEPRFPVRQTGVMNHYTIAPLLAERVGFEPTERY